MNTNILLIKTYQFKPEEHIFFLKSIINPSYTLATSVAMDFFDI